MKESSGDAEACTTARTVKEKRLEGGVYKFHTKQQPQFAAAKQIEKII